MGDLQFLPAVILVVVPILILLAILAHGPRALRWERKARGYGRVKCRTCGHIGMLTIGCRTRGAPASSADLRLICSNCTSADWCRTDEPEGNSPPEK